MSKRNVLLDYIRATSCLLIILYHYTSRYGELFHNSTLWRFSLPWGWMAVSVFFMLSGYLAIASEKQYSSLLGYIQDKVIRLYPAYWVSMTLTFIITSLFLPSKAVSVWEYIVNLTMLESFVGVSLVDGAYWTLANELVFYAFFAFVIVLLRKRDKYQWFILAWLLLLIAYRYIERDGLIYAAIGKLLARPYGHMFIAGSSLHYITKYRHCQPKKRK